MSQRREGARLVHDFLVQRADEGVVQQVLRHAQGARQRRWLGACVGTGGAAKRVHVEAGRTSVSGRPKKSRIFLLSGCAARTGVSAVRRGAARACRLETRLQSARSALCVGFLGRLRRRAGGGEGEQRGEGRQREARRGACSGRSFRALSCARVFWRPIRLTAGRRICARVRCAAWRGCRRRLWVIQLREKKLRAALGHRASARRVDAAFAARLGRRQIQRRHRHAADRLLRAVRLAGSDRRSDRGDRGDVLRHRAQPRRRGLLGRRAEPPRLPTEAERSKT